MIILNFKNIEKLIFHNDDIRPYLPLKLQEYIYTWKMARKASFLRQTAKKAVFDFLNNLTDENIELISELLGETIRVDKVDYKTVKNIKIPISKSEICESLCEIENYNYFTTWRDSNYIYISFWK